jgi:hypothetical protein
MSIAIELEREDDGRWIAEVPALAGASSENAGLTEYSGAKDGPTTTCGRFMTAWR